MENRVWVVHKSRAISVLLFKGLSPFKRRRVKRLIILLQGMVVLRRHAGHVGQHCSQSDFRIRRLQDRFTCLLVEAIEILRILPFGKDLGDVFIQ